MDAEFAEQFRRLGVSIPAGDIAAAPASDADDVPVWPENWPTVRLFLAGETQWRVIAGPAGPLWIGLDYGALDVLARRCGLDEADFAALPLMEAEALQILNAGRDDGL